MPSLKTKYSPPLTQPTMKPNVEPQEMRKTILADDEFKTFKDSLFGHFEGWKAQTTTFLKKLKAEDEPKAVITEISESLLNTFADLPLIDKYDVYQMMMQYWEEAMSDDVYYICVEGWKEGVVDDQLIVKKWFSDLQDEIDELIGQRDEISQDINEIVEEQDPDDDLLEEAKSSKGNITKTSVKDRIKAIKNDPDSSEEMALLTELKRLQDQDSALKREQSKLEKERDEQVAQKRTQLTEDMIKSLMVDDKWMSYLQTELNAIIDQISHQFSSRLQELVEHYAQPLPQIEQEVEALSKKVEEHLKKMGFQWK